MKRASIYLVAFVVAALGELVGCLIDVEQMHWVFKPLIMLSLIGYYFYRVAKPSFIFVVGMCLCCAGDSLLLFQAKHEIFFMLGLAAFLIAHIFYIIAYRQHRIVSNKKDELLNIQKLRLAFPVILAGTGLIVFLYPVLGAMKIPVMIYSGVLVLMVLNSLMRYGHTNSKSFWLVFSGAIMFMCSDSLLAINKFLAPFPLAGFMIMLIYVLAQFSIAEGLIKHGGLRES